MITALTPSLPGRERLLEQCRASVTAAGLKHLVQVDHEHRGPAAIRNELAAQVDTDWLLCLDDDDLLLSHYLQVVQSALEDADVVYTSWYLTGAPDPQPLDAFNAELLRTQNFIPVTAAVRTEAFRAVGGFRDVPLEDHDLWLRLLDAGARFTYIPVVCWRYRRQPGSRTDTEGDR